MFTKFLFRVSNGVVLSCACGCDGTCLATVRSWPSGERAYLEGHQPIGFDSSVWPPYTPGAAKLVRKSDWADPENTPTMFPDFDLSDLDGGENI